MILLLNHILVSLCTSNCFKDLQCNAKSTVFVHLRIKIQVLRIYYLFLGNTDYFVRLKYQASFEFLFCNYHFLWFCALSMPLSFLPVIFFLSFVLFLFEIQSFTDRRKEVRKSFHPQIHFPNDPSCLDWPDSKPIAILVFQETWCSTRMQEPKDLFCLILLSQAH